MIQVKTLCHTEKARIWVIMAFKKFHTHLLKAEPTFRKASLPSS